MPIYEYACKTCDHRFDQLVRTMNADDAKVACPKCGSTKTDKALSVFAVGGESSSSKSTSSSPGMCGRCGGPGPCAME